MSDVLYYEMAIQTPIAPSRREREREEITSWRIQCLQAAGYDAEAAIVIALDRDVDLHRAVSLLERGCPSDLALQILF
ncbi:MAG TPA: hypothetical protein VFC77_04635 [Myxococcota bacterium]|jgi:hypothetical protein|nr:hypothetical protein [Myxococcota bacterium]